jgi:RNase adaptor protein for sRNA GlmZ degradation
MSVRGIEIAGVAGAGKSTLARALCERHAGYWIGDSLHTRVPAHWPYVAHSAPKLVPLLVRSVRHRPALSWEEIKMVIYASEWDRYLESRPKRQGVVIFDQGPLFALARLLWEPKPLTQEDAFTTWVRGTLERWCSVLDAIVWLDAREDTLVDRINHRSKGHEAKGVARADAVQLLAAHRLGYERVLEPIRRVGMVRVLHYDTSARTADELADELAAVLGQTEPGRLTEAGSGTNVS